MASCRRRHADGQYALLARHRLVATDGIVPAPELKLARGIEEIRRLCSSSLRPRVSTRFVIKHPEERADDAFQTALCLHLKVQRLPLSCEVDGVEDSAG